MERARKEEKLSKIRRASGPRRVRSEEGRPSSWSISSFFCSSSSVLLVRSSFSALCPLSSGSVRHFLLFPIGPFAIFLCPSRLLILSTVRARQGQRGPQRPGPGAKAWRTRVRLRLKIALVFDPVFDRFWTVFDPQDGSKIDPKSLPKSIVLCIVSLINI